MDYLPADTDAASTPVVRASTYGLLCVQERPDINGELGVMLEEKSMCRIRIDLEVGFREQPGQ